MAVQNKFEVLGEADEVDHLWAKFKVPSDHRSSRVENKTKQRWMTEDILDFMGKKEKNKI